MQKKPLVISISIIVIGVVVILASVRNHSPRNDLVSTTIYACDAGKTIGAIFNASGSVDLELSDGRAMTLAQTISASGARYASTDESLVFWNKGNGAFVLENNKDKTYVNCIEVAPQPVDSNLSRIYVNSAKGFSIRLPKDYIVDENYVYQAMGPGKDIKGIKFTIPAGISKGTNLSSDSYVSVEQIPKVADCSAKLFLDGKVEALILTDIDTEYSVATSSGVGAGNIYQEKVHALPGTNPCVAVRYMVHYTQIANYPPGKVKEFDKRKLVDQFEQIRRTLVVNQ